LFVREIQDFLKTYFESFPPAKDPGVVLRGAANHNGIAAGFFQHAPGSSYGCHIAIADDRYG
jgi:hypothetical protein